MAMTQIAHDATDSVRMPPRMDVPSMMKPEVL